MERPIFRCIYCLSKTNEFLSVEHPIPESLGNDETILSEGLVCDPCNRYFGSKLEESVLRKAPFGPERIAQAIKSKKGKYPTIQNGGFSMKSTGYWDHVILESAFPHKGMIALPRGGFALKTEWSTPDEIARFLLKMGLGILATADAERVFDPVHSAARECARYGKNADKWDFAMGLWPERESLVKSVRYDEIGSLETRQIYQHEMGIMDSGDVIFCFVFSTMVFAVNLSKYSSLEYINSFNQMNEFEIQSRWELYL